MQVITSKDNEIIKSIRKLKEKKYREESKKFIVEGIKMVEEAMQEKASIDKIVICEDCSQEDYYHRLDIYELAKNEIITVSEKVFKELTNVEKPQGILAVVHKPEPKALQYKEDIIIALDGVQDPGNLGTILRTIDSVGLTQVILGEKTADPYNPKVVRSTMGAIYRVHMIQTENLVNTLKQAKKNQYKIIATALTQDSKSLYDTSLKEKVIVIGNEANGVSEEVLKMTDEKMMIPMLGKTESLNAAVATGVILYEYARNKIKK